MGDNSAIEWTDATWNPVRGCSLVSAGCTNCYAMRQAHRFSGRGQPYEGLTKMTSHGPVWTGKIRLVPELLDQPLHWRKPRRIFVNSMSDLFHENVPFRFVDTVFAIMAMTGRHGRDEPHTFQILTKRPQRMLKYLLTPDRPHLVYRAIEIVASAANENERAGCWLAQTKQRFFPLPNVWLGVSVEDQATADERIPLLLQTPAAVRFLSCEPLLGPISFEGLFANPANPRDGTNALEEIDWLIAGGESGPRARPSHPDWFRDLRDQCQAVGVPFFFKQWGEWEIASAANGHHDCSMASNGARWVHNDGLVNGPSWFRDDKREDTEPVGMIRVGKKAAGNVLDGRTWEEYPR